MPACEEAVFALFHIHPSPDQLLTAVIVDTHEKLMENSNAMSSSAQLSRFLFLLGQAALATLLYVEKIANATKEFSAKAMANEASLSSKDKAKQSKKNQGSSNENEEDNSLEEEMGMSSAIDAEHEKVC